MGDTQRSQTISTVSLRQACVKFPEGHDIIRSRTIWKGDAVSFDLAKQCNEWVKM